MPFRKNRNVTERGITTYLLFFHRVEIVQRYTRLFKENVAPAHETLARLGPKALLAVLDYLIMKLLIRVAHPRLHQLRPMLGGQIAIISNLTCLHEGKGARSADECRGIRRR